MDVKDALNQRRAVNFFDPDKPVTNDEIKEILEAAAKTPSSFNLQPWSVKIFTDPEEKKKLRALAWDQPKVEEAPVVLMFLADRDGYRPGNKTFERVFDESVRAGSMSPDQHDWFENATGSLYGWSDEAALAFAAKNTGFFAMAVMLAAQEAGLKTHPMDGFDHEGVKKAFNIPNNYWVPLLMAVGHFDESKTLNPPKWRKSFEDLVVDF